MRTFSEYAKQRTYEDMKLMILDILDPQRNTIDQDSKSILNNQLSDFKLRNKLLTSPALMDTINNRENRGAILQSIQNDTTTIGNLLSLLSQE